VLLAFREDDALAVCNVKDLHQPLSRVAILRILNPKTNLGKVWRVNKFTKYGLNLQLLFEVGFGDQDGPWANAAHTYVFWFDTGSVFRNK
jgi:hypothetical protein